MKYRLITVGVTVTLMSSMYNPLSQEKGGFIIRGTIQGLPNGTQLYLIQYSTKDTIATTVSRNERFQLTGKVPNGTEYYYIRLDTSVKKNRSSELLLENNDIELNAKLAEWPVVKISGSKSHDEYQEFAAIWDKYKKQINQAKTRLVQKSSKNDSLKESIKQMERNLLAVTKEFINTHRDSYFAPEVITRLQGNFSNEDRNAMYTHLSPDAKRSHFGIALKANLEISAIKEKINPGSIIPNFLVKPQGQQPITILKLASQNKFLLIDFWASWCAPCRKQMPTLKQAYEAFKKDGFNVIGIALNDRDADWQKAVKKDRLPWLNARDEGNKLYELFDVAQIPAYILIDSKGQLISFLCTGSDVPTFGPNLEGEMLYKTVDSLLKKG